MLGLSKRMWQVLREAEQPVTTSQLVILCGASELPNPRHSVWSVLQWWQATDRVEKRIILCQGRWQAVWRISRW